MTYIVKENLERYAPFIFKILGQEKVSWNRITKKFHAKYESRKFDYYKNGVTSVDVNFYDVITLVMKNEPNAIRLLGFFETVINELDKNITDKKLVRKTIASFLLDFSKEYLNYIGELSILNNLTTSGYTLKEVEFPLGNGNNADFRLVGKDGRRILVEVVNIHITDKTPTDKDTLKLFLEGKILDKINSKTKGQKQFHTFYITPVLWGSLKELKPISEIFASGWNMNAEKTLEPCSYASWTDVNNEVNAYRFGKISTLFDTPTVVKAHD